VVTVSTLTEMVRREGRKVLAILLDFKDAFSTISHKFMDNTLKQAGASAKIRTLIRSIYTKAHGKVRDRNADGTYTYSDSFDINRGVIQGDIFSPVVFILGLAAITRKAVTSEHSAKVTTKSGLEISDECYADDTALLAERTDCRDMSDEQHRNELIKTGSSKATHFKMTGYLMGAMEVRADKSVGLIIESGIKAHTSETEICALVKDQSSAKMWKAACPDCGRKFPSKKSLPSHRQHCNMQATTEEWEINKIVDTTTCTTGRHYRVNWKGDDDQGKPWPDSWEPKHRLCDETMTNGTAAIAVKTYWEKKSTTQPPTRGGDETTPKCKGGDFQCPDCPTWWKSLRSVQMHKKGCLGKSKAYGAGSLTTKTVAKAKALRQQTANCEDLRCGDDTIAIKSHAIYLGCDIGTDGDSLTPIDHRLAVARTDFRNMMSIWKDTRLPEKIKLALYQAAIVQAAIHGCQAWKMDKQALRRLNHFNSINMAIITSTESKPVSIHAMAVAPPFDIKAYVKQTRQRWLGKALRLDPSREVHQVLKAQHEAEHYEGSIFNDIPTTTATFKATFPQLVKLAHSPEWNKIIKRGDTHIRPPSAKRGTARTRKIASTTTSTPSEDESQGRTHLNTIGYRTVLRQAASKYSHISIE
jgi:hypothetical protein